MLRLILFLITNFSVMLIFGLILNLTGIQSDNIHRMIIMSGIIGFTGSFISLLLSRWMALRSVNGKLIKKPCNNTEQWLIQTVRQQAYLFGIKMPQVAIYAAADINAFATGARRNASLVAVSTGLLQNMNRQEAEAVLGHEIAHISNGDMVTMTLIQGIVNTFVIFLSRIIAQIATNFMSGSQESENNVNNGHPVVYVAISTVLEVIFGILASIITMWFSRYREFHADADSAKYVGRDKMIAALQRLKTSYEPSEPSNIRAFCINGKNTFLGELFMSHPPLDKRIQALRSGQYLK